MGALCRVGGGGAFGELLPYLTGGIQGNLERDSGEVEQHPELVERLSSSSSSPTSGGRVGTMHVFVHVYVCTSLHYSPSSSPAPPVLPRCSMTQQAGSIWRHTWREHYNRTLNLYSYHQLHVQVYIHVHVCVH